MTDIFVHAVRKESNEIITPEEILLSVDANYDHLSRYYEEVGIKSIVAASASTSQSSIADFDPNLAG